MRKRMLSFVMVLFLIFAFVPAVSVYANELSVAINGQPLSFADQGPVIVDGRTLVPVAGVFQTLGFEVTWDGDTRAATLTGNGYIVVITIDSNIFTTNGISHTLDVPAQIIGGRTMLPIAAVLRSVGHDVAWDEATSTVSVNRVTTAEEAVQLPAIEPTPQPPVVEDEPLEQPAIPELMPEPETTEPQPDDIGQIVSAPNQALRGETLTLTFRGEPNTQYHIRIVSVAGNELATDGLGYATSDSDGIVSWTWIVGSRTGAGFQPVTITGGGKTVQHTIEIIAD